MWLLKLLLVSLSLLTVFLHNARAAGPMPNQTILSGKCPAAEFALDAILIVASLFVAHKVAFAAKFGFAGRTNGCDPECI